jgi:hypothetical protein
MKEQLIGKDFERMLVEAVQENLSFYAWQSIGGVVEKCEMKVKAYRKGNNEIELGVNPDQHNSLSKVISGTRIINIYVPELSISFFSELKSVSIDKKVKIFLPKVYSFYDRRKQERVQPAKPCYVNLEVNKSIMKKSIFDISIGGFAIILPKSDKVFISKGKEIPLMILDVYGRKIKVKTECVSSITIDRFKLENLPYGGYKIAFRFTGISKEDRDYLMEFVTQQFLIQQIKKAN